MKISAVEKNGIKPDVIETVSGLVGRIPWPERRQVMAEVTNRLLDGKPRVADTKAIIHVGDYSRKGK